MQFTIDTERDAPDRMFLRKAIVTGVDDVTGTEIELAMSGAVLIMSVQRPTSPGDAFGEGRVVERLSLDALTRAWVAAIEASS